MEAKAPVVFTAFLLAARLLWADDADCPPDHPSIFALLAAGAHEESGRNVLQVDLAPGAPFSFEVEALLRSAVPPAEPFDIDLCGLLEMSVAHDKASLEMESLSRADDAVMELLEVDNESGSGFVAESPDCLVPAPYPFDGELVLVRARYSLAAPHGPERIGDTISSAIRFQDGLRATGAPYYNSRLCQSGARLRNLEIRIRIREDHEFIRGDTNFDGRLDISDAVTILHGLFLGDAEIHCDDAADLNDDGVVDITDGIYALSYLFLGGKPPPTPYPGPGEDPTPDLLFCFD
jgi:hypothetical protein